MPMMLYGGALSPFVMRVLLAARAKGHELANQPFEGGSKTPEYLAMNPMGKIPLLVDGDFQLPESQTIVDYLDDMLAGPRLVPAAPRAAAHARLLTRIVDCYVIPELGALFGGRDNPAGIEPAKAKIGVALGHLEHFRDAADSHLAGDAFTIADAALIPIVFFLDAFDKTMGTGALIAARPGLAAWWERAKASPLGARAVAEQAAGLAAFRG